MPTPFYHLSLAEELIHRPNLPDPIKHFLQHARCEFLFGNTAPDVQVVSGQARITTHFFDLPIHENDCPPWDQLLADYPHLAAAERLRPSQAAFMAGYLCHLQADWRWILDIFSPVFGPGCSWATFQDRLYYHNILRTYLDQDIIPSLSADMYICLDDVNPDGWLPFVDSQAINNWRDFLSAQLQPGAISQTVQVFSSRQGISAPEYYALLNSTDRMQNEVFRHIPLEQVQSYREAVLDDNVRLLIHYLESAMRLEGADHERNSLHGSKL